MVEKETSGRILRTVAMNIKNPEAEKLAQEIVGITGETKTEAVRRALEERRDRLAFRVTSSDRGGRLRSARRAAPLWYWWPHRHRGRD